MVELRWVPQPGEITFDAIRASGPGGQNVNKVSNAVHLRFDIRASSLPEAVKARLLRWPDQRISADGIVIIKAQEARSLERNRADAERRRPSDEGFDETTIHVPASFLSRLPPAQAQWWRFKAAAWDSVMLFKMGKFYEVRSVLLRAARGPSQCHNPPPYRGPVSQRAASSPPR